MSIVSILGLGGIIWASRNRLCLNFGALQFKNWTLRVNFVLSGLNFGPLRVDFWRWGLDFGPLEVIFGLFWLLGFNFRRLGFDLRTWGVSIVSI